MHIIFTFAFALICYVLYQSQLYIQYDEVSGS